MPVVDDEGFQSPTLTAALTVEDYDSFSQSIYIGGRGTSRSKRHTRRSVAPADMHGWTND